MTQQSAYSSKRSALIFVSILLGLLIFSDGKRLSADNHATLIEVSSDVKHSGVKPLGLNLGAHQQFGASQLLKNLIINPGFEAGEFAMIFNVEAGATDTQVQADNWNTNFNNDSFDIGQPIGFWDGADYEILTGSLAGQRGTIESFSHADDKYTFTFDSIGTAPATSDAFAVRKTIEEQIAVQNSSPIRILTPVELTQFLSPDEDTRPNSEGTQSMRLLPTEFSFQPSWSYYMDSFWRDADRTAGKLYIVEGAWRFAIWAKSDVAGDTLRVRFYREGEAVFLEESAPLTTDWQLIEFEFDVASGTEQLEGYTLDEYHPILALDLFVDGDNDVWVDDVFLGRRDYTNPTVFSDTIVDRLNEINVGVLRNWGNQLGSTLDNQLASPEARRTTGHSPRERVPSNFHYSLHEFLELANEIGAEPWYVVPPTFTNEEWLNLIAYLSANAGQHPYASLRASLGQNDPWTTIFPTIHLEYGNEMWGSNDGDDPFIGATLRGGQRVGEKADDIFAQAQTSPYFQANKFNLIIGGQAGFPPQNNTIEQNSSTHSTVALAPYFGTLENWSTDEEIFLPLYANPLVDIASDGSVGATAAFLETVGQGTEQAIYELNFEAITGSAPLDVRNDFVTSVGGGIALPLHMLTYLDAYGIKNQAAFTTAQYAFDDNGDDIRLWGVLRDLEATGRKRPTGLALEIVNQVIKDQLIETVQSGTNPFHDDPAVPIVQSFAFRDGDTMSLILFNLNLDSTENVQLDLELAPESAMTMRELSADSIHDDNEDSETVIIETSTIADFTADYDLTLAPYSITTLEWEIQPSDPNAISLLDFSSTNQQTNILIGIGLLAIMLIAVFAISQRKRLN